jgi:XTP/dITP diphosphohydrolase
MRLYYITGNKNKFATANKLLGPFDIEIEQKTLEIPEMQSDSIEDVAKDKAQKAFEIVKAPLFVNDSGWNISALKGFPGPYMKYINEWFEAEDFINLMKNYKNREVVLRQVIVYIDKNSMKIFSYDSAGKILDKPYSNGSIPSDRVISLSKDDFSIAEEKVKLGFSVHGEETLWHDFANWLKTV